MRFQDIYPSADFEDSYKTNTPRLFAIVVASTFVFVVIVSTRGGTSAVFTNTPSYLTYDILSSGFLHV